MTHPLKQVVDELDSIQASKMQLDNLITHIHLSTIREVKMKVLSPVQMSAIASIDMFISRCKDSIQLELDRFKSEL